MPKKIRPLSAADDNFDGIQELHNVDYSLQRGGSLSKRRSKKKSTTRLEEAQRAQMEIKLFFVNLLQSRRAKHIGVPFIALGVFLSMMLSLLPKLQRYNTFLILGLSASIDFKLYPLKSVRAQLLVSLLVMLSIAVDIFQVVTNRTLSHLLIAAIAILILAKLFILSSFLRNSQGAVRTRKYLNRRARLFYIPLYQPRRIMRDVRGRIVAIGWLQLGAVIVFLVLFAVMILQLDYSTLYLNPTSGTGTLPMFLLLKAASSTMVLMGILYDTDIRLCFWYFGLLGCAVDYIRKYIRRKRIELKGFPLMFSFSSLRFNILFFVKGLDILWGIYGWFIISYTFGSKFYSLDTKLQIFFSCIAFSLTLFDLWCASLFLGVRWLLRRQKVLARVEGALGDSDDSEIEEFGLKLSLEEGITRKQEKESLIQHRRDTYMLKMKQEELRMVELTRSHNAPQVRRFWNAWETPWQPSGTGEAGAAGSDGAHNKNNEAIIVPIRQEELSSVASGSTTTVPYRDETAEFTYADAPQHNPMLQGLAGGIQASSGTERKKPVLSASTTTAAAATTTTTAAAGVANGSNVTLPAFKPNSHSLASRSSDMEIVALTPLSKKPTPAAVDHPTTSAPLSTSNPNDQNRRVSWQRKVGPEPSALYSATTAVEGAQADSSNDPSTQPTGWMQTFFSAASSVLADNHKDTPSITATTRTSNMENSMQYNDVEENAVTEFDAYLRSIGDLSNRSTDSNIHSAKHGTKSSDATNKKKTVAFNPPKRSSKVKDDKRVALREGGLLTADNSNPLLQQQQHLKTRLHEMKSTPDTRDTGADASGTTAPTTRMKNSSNKKTEFEKYWEDGVTPREDQWQHYRPYQQQQKEKNESKLPSSSYSLGEESRSNGNEKGGMDPEGENFTIRGESPMRFRLGAAEIPSSSSSAMETRPEQVSLNSLSGVYKDVQSTAAVTKNPLRDGVTAAAAANITTTTTRTQTHTSAAAPSTTHVRPTTTTTTTTTTTARKDTVAPKTALAARTVSAGASASAGTRKLLFAPHFDLTPEQFESRWEALAASESKRLSTVIFTSSSSSSADLTGSALTEPTSTATATAGTTGTAGTAVRSSEDPLVLLQHHLRRQCEAKGFSVVAAGSTEHGALRLYCCAAALPKRKPPPPSAATAAAAAAAAAVTGMKPLPPPAVVGLVELILYPGASSSAENGLSTGSGGVSYLMECCCRCDNKALGQGFLDALQLREIFHFID